MIRDVISYSINGRIVAAVARAGSLLAVALTLWYASTATGAGMALFLPASLFCAVMLWRTRKPPPVSDSIRLGVPLVPLLVVLAIVLSPSLLLIRGASGAMPHWFASSDEAYTLMIARGLRAGFPPVDLSWSGATVRYHLGAAMLVDLLSRLIFLPVHTIYYGAMPILIKIILVAAVLEFARRIAPEVPPAIRVWTPAAVSGLVTIDGFNVLWHVHDALVRGLGAYVAGVPMATIESGLFSRPALDSGWLAIAFFAILLGTWERATPFEQAALLFTIFLVKSQVFLAVGAGWGVMALFELRRGRWKPCLIGAAALAGALAVLPAESTYGSLAHLSLGCGAECLHLLEGHQLTAKLLAAAVLPVEIALLGAGLHLFLIALLRRRSNQDTTLTLPLAVMAAGLAVASTVKLIPSPLLRDRFLTVYAPIADRLFMPLGHYLDRIFDVAVDSAFDAFLLVLPLLAVPMVGSWMISTRRRWVRRALAIFLAGTLAASIWSSSVAGSRRWLDHSKEVAADAMAALRSIPNGPHVILTNDLAYDDVVERHLPLLNVWAPAVSGRQFWASAFMFNFQYPDAGDRLRRARWVFGSAGDADRIRFARAAGIDLLLVRVDRLPSPQQWRGWTLIARNGRYELYRLARDNR